MVVFRALLLVGVAMLTGCGDAVSPEQQVQRVLDQIEAAVESRDTSKLVQHLSAEYRDVNGMSREEAVRHVRGYFFTTHQLHLLPMGPRIEFPLPDEARVRVLVGMLAGEADAAGNWDRVVDSYEFKLVLRQEGGEWKVSFAEWSRK
jgi:hypothetical protein